MTKSRFEEIAKQSLASEEAGDTPEDKLVLLPIPVGWAVTYNALFAGDPIIDTENDLIENFTAYKEDVLTLERMAIEGSGWVIPKENNLLIDVGWYPDSDPSGEYVLRLYRNKWHDCVHEKAAPDQKTLVEKLDDLLNSDLTVHLGS